MHDVPSSQPELVSALCADVMNNRLLCFYSGRHHLLRQYHLPCECNNKIRNALFTIYVRDVKLLLSLSSLLAKHSLMPRHDALFLRPLFCLSTRLCICAAFVRGCCCVLIPQIREKEWVKETDGMGVCSSAQNALWWLMAQKDKRKSQKCFTNDLRFPAAIDIGILNSITPNFAFI